MDGYPPGSAADRADPRGGPSANGTKVWGGWQPADPQRAKANRAAVVVRILARYPGLAQDMGAMLRADVPDPCRACAGRLTGTGALC